MNIYQIMITKHNDFCSCNYCDKLRKYVSLKRYKSSFNRRYTEYENNMDTFNHSLEREFLYNHHNLKREIKNLKIEKDKLKLINI